MSGCVTLRHLRLLSYNSLPYYCYHLLSTTTQQDARFKCEALFDVLLYIFFCTVLLIDSFKKESHLELGLSANVVNVHNAPIALHAILAFFYVHVQTWQRREPRCSYARLCISYTAEGLKATPGRSETSLQDKPPNV